MKAIRKSDGKVIEVREWSGASDVVYSDPDMNRFYQASDLDFTRSESDQHISIFKLRDILEDVASSQFEPRRLNDATINEIINRIKESI